MELSTTATADARRARRKLEYVPDDPLLTAAEAAAERGQALSTFWRDVQPAACRRPTMFRPDALGGAGRNFGRGSKRVAHRPGKRAMKTRRASLGANRVPLIVNVTLHSSTAEAAGPD